MKTSHNGPRLAGPWRRQSLATLALLALSGPSFAAVSSSATATLTITLAKIDPSDTSAPSIDFQYVDSPTLVYGGVGLSQNSPWKSLAEDFFQLDRAGTQTLQNASGQAQIAIGSATASLTTTSPDLGPLSMAISGHVGTPVVGQQASFGSSAWGIGYGVFYLSANTMVTFNLNYELEAKSSINAPVNQFHESAQATAFLGTTDNAGVDGQPVELNETVVASGAQTQFRQSSLNLVFTNDTNSPKFGVVWTGLHTDGSAANWSLVPEPSSSIMALAGAALVGWRYRRRVVGPTQASTTGNPS